MSYLTQILQPDERVLFDGHLHWIIYRQAILLLVLAALAAAALHYSDDQNGLKFGLLSLVFIFGVLGLVSGLLTWLRSFSTEIAVTTTRVIYKTGFIRRHTVEMNTDKVESVDVDQSLFGRLLGYGSVRIRGTGASLEKLDHIANAIALRNTITSR